MKPKDYINKKAQEEALKAFGATQLNNNQESSAYFVGKINADRTKITDPEGRQYDLIFTGNPKEYELAQRLSDNKAVVNAQNNKTINIDGVKKRPYFLYKFFNRNGTGTNNQRFLGFSLVRLKKRQDDEEYDFEYFDVPTEWLPTVIFTSVIATGGSPQDGTVVYGKIGATGNSLVIWSCEYFKSGGDSPQGNLALHYSHIKGIKYSNGDVEASSIIKGSIDLIPYTPPVTLETFTDGSDPPPQPLPNAFSTATCDIQINYTCEEDFSYSNVSIIRTEIPVVDLVISGDSIDAIIAFNQFEAFITEPQQLFSTQTMHVFGSSVQNGPYTYDSLTRYQYAFPTPILLEYTVNSTGVFPPGSTSIPICSPQSTSYYSALTLLYGDSGFNYPGVTTTNSGVARQTIVIEDLLGAQVVTKFPIDYLDNSVPLAAFPNSSIGNDNQISRPFIGAVSFGDYKTSAETAGFFNTNGFNSIYNTPTYFTTKESFNPAMSTHVLLLLSTKFNYFIPTPTNDEVLYYYARSCFTVSSNEFMVCGPGLVNSNSGGGPTVGLDPNEDREITINKVTLAGDGSSVFAEKESLSINFDSANEFFNFYKSKYSSAQNFQIGINSALLI